VCLFWAPQRAKAANALRTTNFAIDEFRDMKIQLLLELALGHQGVYCESDSASAVFGRVDVLSELRYTAHESNCATP
jgi:hypothetical protein